MKIGYETVEEMIRHEHKTYTFTEKELQKIVDAFFELVSRAGENGTFMTRDQWFDDNMVGSQKMYMKFVANILREYGIDTSPIGISWGVLK
jgi:hypothetical protein